jgi:CBS domain-containing protein
MQRPSVRRNTTGESTMKIRDIMTRDVKTIGADESLRAAALIMQIHDIGSVPVAEQQKLVGMVTDRDIVLRAVAAGRTPDTPVREVMSSGIKYCYEDDDLDDVARNMSNLCVRRLPVLDEAKNLVGIVSLANVSSSGDSGATQELLEATAKPH